jgi:hypothetical protein
MLWIRLPVEDDESDLMPLSRRHQISVYDRVIVGLGHRRRGCWP